MKEAMYDEFSMKYDPTDKRYITTGLTYVRSVTYSIESRKVTIEQATEHVTALLKLIYSNGGGVRP